MFTGIIQFQSRVQHVKKSHGGITLAIQKPRALKTQRGASVAVNGICSTVSGISKTAFSFEYMPETLRVTNVGMLTIGDVVNLEQSLTPASLLDGHLVMGHVDGVGIITKIIREGSSKIFHIKIKKELMPYIAPKGSVAIEGMSLTIAKKMKDGFAVALTPYTLGHTNLGSAEVGDAVNIECDSIAKYLRELIEEKRHANKRRK